MLQERAVKYLKRGLAFLLIIMFFVFSYPKIAFADTYIIGKADITKHEPGLKATPEEDMPFEKVKPKKKSKWWVWVLTIVVVGGLAALAGGGGGGGGSSGGGGGGGEPLPPPPP